MDYKIIVVYAFHVLYSIPLAILASYCLPSLSFRLSFQGPITPDSLSMSHALVDADYSQISKILELSSSLRSLYIQYKKWEDYDERETLPVILLYGLLLPGFMYCAFHFIVGSHVSPIFFIIGYFVSQFILRSFTHIQSYSENKVDEPKRPPINPSTEDFITFWENEYSRIADSVNTRNRACSKIQKSVETARTAMIFFSIVHLMLFIVSTFQRP